ncbi:hypothetical protein TSUD_258600 [Trifolium subterraneum]|uniref:TIR domain-containing protein n=1 Tax=Trifolium subterraneum TaxID=3900 RepID=A0A2Z6PAQ4_TRISU|nr:hypothetical protein TSUD_258600 [Trifolium subterraneum]
MAMLNDGADANIAATNNYKYDVFLSFYGPDTRSTFTGNLYHALRQKRIKTIFLDDALKTPEEVLPVIIKESRISIVVLSKNYGSSRRCLDELVNIHDCMMNNNQNRVWPIFYEVDPSSVIRQVHWFEKLPDKLPGSSDDHHSLRQGQWKNALFNVGWLAGWVYKSEQDYEYELIQKIVKTTIQSLPRYDIFLSFCGEDTRYSFTGFLYQAFCREGFKTFMDDEGLEGGNEISKSLLEAIEKSRLSIVVFSKNYGYSSWCLDELVKIVECMKTKNQLVWPIFYKIEPSEIINETKSYGKAMTGHENKYGKDSEKVQKWRSALSEVASLEGDHIKKNEYETEVIKKIVERAIEAENQM